jgi:chromosome segregation ATPase
VERIDVYLVSDEELKVLLKSYQNQTQEILQHEKHTEEKLHKLQEEKESLEKRCTHLSLEIGRLSSSIEVTINKRENDIKSIEKRMKEKKSNKSTIKVRMCIRIKE